MADRLSATFAALADPTRRAMLARLARKQANVSDIAEPFLHRMSLPAVTKHLKVLEKAGLISKTRHAQQRTCELKPEGFLEVAEWMDLYRKYWEESFDRLDDYLKNFTEKAKDKKHGRKKAGQ